MMQVSTLYAQSLERQLVSRRSQIIQNLSRANCAPLDHQAPLILDAFDQNDLLEQVENCAKNIIEQQQKQATPQLEDLAGNQDAYDAKECTDRLCRLPSQCKGKHILGAPRRSNSMAQQARLSQSAGNLNIVPQLDLLKEKKLDGSNTESPPLSPKSLVRDKKALKKEKEKEKKEAKKSPSNFMLLSTWSTRTNCDKLMNQVKSGDILEFNIKLHHHWGIGYVQKNKKPNLETVELIHLAKDKEGRQRVVRQRLIDYWGEGVTARINNSRDVHKPPQPAGEVTQAALKLIVQPYRIWNNSEQMVTSCRYGDGLRARQLSDAARWGSLSKCVGLWMTLTSSNHSSPTGSPAPLRKRRTYSVNF